MELNITEQEFIKLYNELTYIELQKKLNLSSATIAKLAKKLNLKKPRGPKGVKFKSRNN